MFSEYRVQMSKYSQCPFCSPHCCPPRIDPGYWSGTVCIVAHLIIETQGHILSWSVVTRVTMGDGDMRGADTSDI